MEQLLFPGDGGHPAISRVRLIDGGAYGDVYEVIVPILIPLILEVS